MPSKLFLVIDAHTKFEVSSFNHSRDIRVRILKICVSSAILDLTLSGFWQFHSFRGATEYHLVKFECNQPCAAEIEWCNCFSNCRTLGAPNGQMDLRVGGPSCTESAADESPDIAAIRYCFRFFIFCSIFKPECLEYEGLKNGGKISHFLTPLWKIRDGWWRCLYKLFVPHIGSKHRYTFYPVAIGGLVTLDGWLKKEEPAVKHIASGLVLPVAKVACKCVITTAYTVTSCENKRPKWFGKGYTTLPPHSTKLSWAAWQTDFQTDRQTPHTSVTIVCISSKNLGNSWK